ncbi:MAG: hypothetical protein ACE141_09495 [Bryobacteraceae bacterium]
MFDPTLVKSASDLPSELPVVIESQGNINLKARQPLLYSFHWLREVSSGLLDGDLGLKVDAGGEVSAQLAVTDTYRREISLDERGWLRLQIFKCRNRDFDFASRLSVSAQAATPLPDKPDALVAAILGVHEGQWPEDLGILGAAVRARSAQLADLWNAFTVSGEGRSAQVLGALLDLDGWTRNQIESLVGPIRSEADVARLLASFRTLVGLRDSVYAKAVAAFEKKYDAEVSYRYASATQESALFDGSFAFTERGLAAYRKALEGDLTWILAADPGEVEIRQGVLTDGLTRQTTLELHLPFLGRKEWVSRLEALARMEVTSDADGRLLVYHVKASDRVTSRNSYQSVLALAGGLSVGRTHSSSSFTLTYCDRRQVPCRQAPQVLAPVLRAYGFAPEAARWLGDACSERDGSLDLSLALSIPGSLVSAWLDAPGERSPDFFSAYARVSVAVQRAIRVWLPYTYFSDPERYGTLDAAFPLVVYQASRPFSGRPKYDFTYDVLSEPCMAGFFRMAGSQLQKDLARIEELLLSAGEKRTASFYNPKQARNILASVQRKPKLLHSLLVADAFLVNALVNLGCQGAGLREKAAKDPAGAVKHLTRFAAELVKAFHGKLRRLYGGREFLALGGLLLVEATAALKGDTGAPSSVQAVLRVSQEELGQTLLNRAYLPAE